MARFFIRNIRMDPNLANKLNYDYFGVQEFLEPLEATSNLESKMTENNENLDFGTDDLTDVELDSIVETDLIFAVEDYLARFDPDEMIEVINGVLEDLGLAEPEFTELN